MGSLDAENAWGDETSTQLGGNLVEQVLSRNQESPSIN